MHGNQILLTLRFDVCLNNHKCVYNLSYSVFVSKMLPIEDKFIYNDKEYARATEGVVPEETDEICIITPGSDLNSVLVPDSVKDMVLARMDRMSLNEQTVLKCAAVLGTLNFIGGPR